MTESVRKIQCYLTDPYFLAERYKAKSRGKNITLSRDEVTIYSITFMSLFLLLSSLGLHCSFLVLGCIVLMEIFVYFVFVS